MKILEEMNPELNSLVNNFLSEIILKHTCHLVCQESSIDKINTLGTGVLAEIGKHKYLLTASHVAEIKEKETRILVPVKDGYVQILGVWKFTEIERSNNIDLAYVKLYEDVALELNKFYSFIAFSKISPHEMLNDLMNRYVIVGYPEIYNKKVEYKASEAVGLILPPAKIKVYQYYKIDPRIHHILDLNGKCFDIKSGNETKADKDHHGLSGSGIYKLSINKHQNKYSIDYKLISILTDKKTKHYSLIGNRIEHILYDLINSYTT